MMTSNFTLEYYPNDDETQKWTANIPRTLPPQLERLGVRETVWMKIYDYAGGVADRAAMREAIKEELDKWLSCQKGTKQHKEKSKAKVAKEKENHNKETWKGWNNILDRCTNELSVFGVSASLMLDRETIMPFGVSFRCDASKLLPNKLKLQYNHRADTWTWPRDEVPMELKALHVGKKTWSSVWEMARRTQEKTGVLDREKKIIQKKLARFFAVEVRELNVGKEQYEKAMLDINKLERSIDSEWGILLEFAEDTFYMWGISVQLSYSERDSGSKFCGIILRFRPITSTVPVVNDATIALPMPSAPDSA